MKTALDLFLILHFIGMVALLGGMVEGMRAPVKRITTGMFHGAMTMLVTGMVMIGIAESLGDEDITANHTKFGVKGLILAVIITLVMSGRKKESVDKAVYASIGLLAIANIAIAVLWQ